MMHISNKKHIKKSSNALFGFWRLEFGASAPAARRGAALLIAVMFLVAVSAASAAAMALPLVKHLRVTQESIRSREAFFFAEALVEDIVYRYKAGMDVDSAEALSVSGHTANASIANTPFGRTVISTADVENAVRRVQTDLIAGVGSSFSFGVQTGTGGFILHNNATVNGNVYANGNITGASGARITGSAFAANSAALASDQANTAPATPPSTINFGNAAATQDIAQSFQVSAEGRINKVQLYVRKTGNPASATVRIANNAGGNPGNTTLTSGTLAASQVTGSLGWVEVVFANNPELAEGTTYWLVIDNASNNASNYYAIGANSAYAAGTAKIGRLGTSWSATSPADLDIYFSAFLGGVTSTIHDVDIGTAGVGDAHAHTVTNSTVAGTLYCATGSGNNKACDTSREDPAPQGFPISQANIDEWKQEAQNGVTIVGDHVVTAPASLGPAVITGNLVVNTNMSLTLTGTVWVQGAITTQNNTTVRLASGYSKNSGVLLSDGRIAIANNTNFQGSGAQGSYLLLLTTSDCPESSSCSGERAVRVENNAGAVIINAQNGTIYFSNNAGAKQATAHTIELANNAAITYENGLISLNFVSGPGGSFDITGWQEIE